MKFNCPKHGEVEYIVCDYVGTNVSCGICYYELMKNMGFETILKGPTIYIDEVKNRRFRIKKNEE